MQTRTATHGIYNDDGDRIGLGGSNWLADDHRIKTDIRDNKCVYVALGPGSRSGSKVELYPYRERFSEQYLRTVPDGIIENNLGELPRQEPPRQVFRQRRG